jgi:hypothetical protein
LGATAIIQIRYLRRADETARITANAAKQSADATRDSVELAEKTAERQLRSYVTISETYISDINAEYPAKGVDSNQELGPNSSL